jgi:hypothetical protein
VSAGLPPATTSQTQTSGPVPPPLLHRDSGSLRFWVMLPAGQPIGASVPWRVLHYRFDARLDGSDAIATYEAHRSEMDAAVLRRASSGSIEPVMLREHDLPPDRR